MFIFYIDDSGTKEFTDPQNNFFSYGGVLVNNSETSTISSEIIDLKKRYFNNESPEIKSHWLRRPEKRDKYFLTPYSISNRALNSFTTELFEYITTIDIKAFGVVIDKQKLKDKYSNSFYPSSICYEFLLQRIANVCTQLDIDKVMIVMDDMSGKTPKGKEWKKLLIQQHKKLLSGSSPFYRNWSQRTGMNYSKISKNLRFVDSKDSELTQVADLCAYNIMRQARDSWKNFDEAPLYAGYNWIKEIMHKCPTTNKIIGYGAVCFP